MSTASLVREVPFQHQNEKPQVYQWGMSIRKIITCAIIILGAIQGPILTAAEKSECQNYWYYHTIGCFPLVNSTDPRAPCCRLELNFMTHKCPFNKYQWHIDGDRNRRDIRIWSCIKNPSSGANSCKWRKSVLETNKKTCLIPSVQTCACDIKNQCDWVPIFKQMRFNFET